VIHINRTATSTGVGFSEAGMGVSDKGFPVSVVGVVVFGAGAVFSDAAKADLEVKPPANPMVEVKAAQSEVVSDDVKEENQLQLSGFEEVKPNPFSLFSSSFLGLGG
jgi:hypothetical protein